MRCKTIDLKQRKYFNNFIFDWIERTWESGRAVSIDNRDIEKDERKCRTSVVNVDELSVGNDANNVAESITSNRP